MKIRGALFGFSLDYYSKFALISLVRQVTNDLAANTAGVGHTRLV
ncbi:MAG: hypothetical protein Q8Q95_01130 [bacterium]|nr:hypothetical protein [bacterium]